MAKSLREKWRQYLFENGFRRIFRKIFRVLFFLYILAQIFMIFGTPYVDNTFNFDVQAGQQKFAALVTDKAVIKEKLKPKTEKYYAGKMSKAEFGICYIHGFSASRQELEPVISRLAKKLQANLFFTRLAGHGYENPEILRTVNAQDWIKDAVECVEAAARTGQKVVLIGTSMGAALASLVAANTKYKIHTLALISPYFGVKDRKADLLAGYFGDYIADIYFKGYRSFKPVNDLQAQYWTTQYPARVLKQVMRISMSVQQTNFENIKAPVFVAYSKDDEVIDFTKVEKKYDQIQTHKRMDSDPTYLSHILAGDIVNPRGNAKLQKNLYSFIKANY